MPTLNEIRDERNKLLTDAQKVLLASPDNEKRASAQRMLADADALESDISNLERIAKFESEERGRTTPPRGTPNGGTDTEARGKLEKEALTQYLRGNVDAEHQGVLRETRDLTTSTVGQFIPQTFYPVLTQAQKSYGQIVNECTSLQTDTGAPMKFATASDLSNSMVVLGEGTAVSESDPTIGGSTISTDFCSVGLSKISIAALQDSSFDIESFMRDNLGARMYRGIANWVVNGNSSNVTGLIASVASTATTAAAGVISWHDIAVGLYSQLDPAYEPNAAFGLNTATRGLLLGTTDTLGRPLYVPSPSADAFDMLLGQRVFISTYHPAPTAGNTPITYGDHKAYLIRTVKPTLAISVLRERFMDQGEVGIVGFVRVGGALLQNSAASPIVGLVMHA